MRTTYDSISWVHVWLCLFCLMTQMLC